MQVTHTHDGIIVDFNKNELLTQFTSEQYVCFRISSMMCEVDDFKDWYGRIKDQNVICDFLIGLLAREMNVAPETLYCSSPIEVLVETRGIFGIINSTAAEFIAEHYDFWMYDLDGSSSNAITSDSYTNSESVGWVAYHGFRAEFINALIEKNMRDDEILTVEFNYR